MDVRDQEDTAGTTDERARLWSDENADAIKAHREQIEKYGVFGEDMRAW